MNLYLTLDAADQRHRAYATYIFQTFFNQLIGNRGQLAHAVLAFARIIGHGHRENRTVCRVVACDARFLHFLAENRFDQRDFFTHILRCLCRVDHERKLDDDDRLTLIRARGQAVDAIDGINSFFDLACDVGLDRFRCRARIFRLYDDDRKGHIWELIHPQSLIRKQTQNDKSHHHHGGQNRIADTDACKPHGAGSCLSSEPWLAQPLERACQFAGCPYRCAPPAHQNLDLKLFQ